MEDLSSEQAKDIVRAFPEQGGQEEQEIVGAIFDQDEALDFLKWLMSDEARAIAQQLREQQEAGEQE